jgi:very-short-patch-repair endonuclease
MQGQSSRFARRRAVELRRVLTDAEQVLWFRLRRNHLGARFHRQHPFERYILDFVRVERRLVIEVDGSQRLDCKKDIERTSLLERAGFRVLRFWDNQVLNETDAVLEAIFVALNPPRACKPKAFRRRRACSTKPLPNSPPQPSP